MKRHKITGHEAYLIKAIARTMPDMEYNAFLHKPTNERFRKIFNWMATKWLTAKLCRWYFNRNYTQKIKWNHDRRLRRAFQAAGIAGIAQYMNKMGFSKEQVIDNIKDF